MKRWIIWAWMAVQAGCVNDAMIAMRNDGSASRTSEGGGEMASDVPPSDPPDIPSLMDVKQSDGTSTDLGMGESDAGVVDTPPVVDRPIALDSPNQSDATDAEVGEVGMADGGFQDAHDVSDVVDLADVADHEVAVDRLPTDAVEVDLPAGWIVCSSGDGEQRAVNPNTDFNNCGGCDRRCCGRFCIEGHCTSDGPPGTIACPLTPEEERSRGCFGDIQVLPASDPNHCGTCETRCGPGQTCMMFICSGG